jgi:hypothetical protein
LWRTQPLLALENLFLKSVAVGGCTCARAGISAGRLADSDAGFRQVLKAMLSGIADRLIEAEGGEQALAIVANGGVDLVLTDLVLAFAIRGISEAAR